MSTDELFFKPDVKIVSSSKRVDLLKNPHGMLEAVAIQRGTTGVQYSSKHLLVIHGIDGIFQQTQTTRMPQITDLGFRSPDLQGNHQASPQPCCIGQQSLVPHRSQ